MMKIDTKIYIVLFFAISLKFIKYLKYNIYILNHSFDGPFI